MEIPDNIDALVIGAGPAGGVAALTLCRNGCKTLLIDSKPRLGERPHCGELLSVRALSEFPIDRKQIYQRTEFMETWINYEPVSRPVESPGFIIDRPALDRGLARLAAASGCHVISSAKFVRFSEGKAVILLRGEEKHVKAAVIIAADGADSSARRSLGAEKADYLIGIQAEVPLKNKLDRTMIFFDPRFRAGYGWLFPKNDVANAGIGLKPGTGAPVTGLLEYFLDELITRGLIRPGILSRTGGLIPVSGLINPMVCGNVLFCGDSAGLTHPITGGGIAAALHSGREAAHAALEFISTGARRALDVYEEGICSKYGGIYAHAAKKRKRMETQWNSADFQELIHETWIGFSGYKRRERV